MKQLFSIIFCSIVISSPLMGVEPLNELEYKAEIKKASKVTRNVNITLTQDDQLVATASSFWNLAQFPDKATYVLKDADKKVIAIAKAYLKQGQPYALYFDMSDGQGDLLGSLILSYDPNLETSKITVPTGAVLFSKEGVPLLEDTKVWSWYRYWAANIPGTKETVADIQCDSLFWTNKWHAKIADLAYVAQMNISPELFLLYYAVRSDYYHYQYKDIANVNTRK